MTEPPNYDALVNDPCCRKILLKLEDECTTKNASNLHSFNVTLETPSGPTLLVVSNSNINLTSSCEEYSGTLSSGSYKIHSLPTSKDCVTKVSNSNTLIQGTLSILKYAVDRWITLDKTMWIKTNNRPIQAVRPADGDDPNHWNSTSLYLLLGLSFMSTIVIVTLTLLLLLWYRNRNQQENPRRNPSSAPLQTNSVQSTDLPLRPILKHRQRSPTPTSSSSSNSSFSE